MGMAWTKLIPWYVFDSPGDEEDTEQDDDNDDYEYEDEKYPNVLNEDDRLRGCRVGSRIIPVGTCWTDRRTCTYYQCRDFNRLTTVTCPENPYSNLYHRCKEIPGDETKDYPDCCATVECEKPKFNTMAELDALGDLCDDPRNCL